MTRKTLFPTITMDKSPALSFGFPIKNALPVQVSSQHATGSFCTDMNDDASDRSNRNFGCGLCQMQFQDYQYLLLHQRTCSMTAAASITSLVCSKDIQMPGNALPFAGAAVRAKAPLVPKNSEVEAVNNRFSGHGTRRQQLMLQEFARQKARIRAQKRRQLVSQWDPPGPIHAHWAPKRRRVASPESPPCQRMCQDDFALRLGLVTSSSADRLKETAAASQSSVDLDCQIVAVEGPIAGQPFHSPRTTRSLMSQLSRESAEAARKRLSFCLENEEASESEIFDGRVARRTTQGSLLAIDFSSPLGQRLKRHMKSDLVVPPIADVEQYCLLAVQEGVSAKLRYRVPDYPIMHRKRKGMVTGYSHTFKFNSNERKEFRVTLRTGLNARSRHLQRITKKCVIRLGRLRPDEIHHWTLRRRTIVNQEITIDDDISIVQVDVPEHMFNAVQKMPVPYPRAGFTVSGMPYPYPTSCFRAPAQGARPQFLVKQVNKNWTENGKDTQKLVFVPLEDLAPASASPSLSARGLQPGSSQRPSKPNPSGIQKSLPPHLRPCPKSRRKRLPEIKQDSDDDITVETASSSSEESYPVPRRDSRVPQQDQVYPLALTRAVNPWMMPEKPVPHMLFHAPTSTSDSGGVSNQVTPVSLLAQQLRHSGPEQPGWLDSLASAHGLVPVTCAGGREDSLELRRQLSMFNLTPGGQTLATKTEERRCDSPGAKVSAVNSDCGPQLSIGSVYSARDLSDRHVAASLGLEVTPSSSASQPNFLQQPGLRSLLSANTSRYQQQQQQQQQPASHHSLQQSSSHPHPQPSLSQGADMRGYPPPQPGFSKVKVSPGHQPSILRGPSKLPAPSNPSPSSLVKASSTKPSPFSNSKGWTITLASDDDVVEVICIDDDD